MEEGAGGEAAGKIVGVNMTKHRAGGSAGSVVKCHARWTPRGRRTKVELAVF